MLDTNVLVDYYLGREPGCSACASIIDLAQDAHPLYAAALSLKDVYYLVGATLKRLQRSERGELGDADAHACNQIAWSCVRHALDVVLVANTGRSECLDAFVLRSLHDDFEDDLVAASARAVQADFLVTSDERLMAHSPVAALTPQNMVRLLQAEGLTSPASNATYSR